VEIVEIFLSESGDVELGAWTSKHILVFAFGYLSKLYFLYISHCYYCSFIHAWYCGYTCIIPREFLKHLNSNLEESWGEVLKPFTGNSASLFGYHLCLILLV